MPAQTSSPIDPALGHLLAVAEPFADDRVGLLMVVTHIPDPRKARGIRHQFQAVLALAVCAVLAGARSYVAIAEWAGDADALTLSEVGAGTAVPCETTFRRTLQSLDADLLDDRLGAGASERTRPAPGSRRLIGVDGKTLRGSACDTQPGRHYQRDPSVLHASGPHRAHRHDRDRRRDPRPARPTTRTPTTNDQELLTIKPGFVGALHRRTLRTRWRVLSSHQQAVMVLAHLPIGETYQDLDVSFGVGTTTAYWYLREALTVLAALAPTVAQVTMSR